MALAATSAPVTRPRLATNQRLATVAASTVAMQPVPSPTRTPQHSTSCHLVWTRAANPDPLATRSNATGTTRRNPNLTSSAAAKGPISPNSKTFTDTAKPMSPLLHPNSSCNGSIKTAGDARNPAARSKMNNVAPNTTHA